MTPAEEMVRTLRTEYGFGVPKIEAVMLTVLREKFANPIDASVAYDDRPVDIGHKQTMSQPYTVAFMTSLLLSDPTLLATQETSRKKAISDKTRDWRVLEIGSGTGYQAAVLSRLVKEVYTIEIIPELARKARKILKKLNYSNVHVRSGSGEYGWEKHAPYDAVIVTAGVVGEVPRVLFDQLKVGGVLIAPVGDGNEKKMTRYVKKNEDEVKVVEFGVFYFVPFLRE